jgi:hypothetical protein
MLNVIMLIVIMLNVVMLIVIMLIVVMLIVIMLIVVMLNVIMLIVVMLRVVAPYFYNNYENIINPLCSKVVPITQAFSMCT